VYAPLRNEIVHYYKGGKWEGLFDFFTKNPELLSKYTHIWLPDDDLGIKANGIVRLFEICEKHNLAVGQPGLSWNSYYNHFITLQNRRFILRYVNFVEVMAPVLAAETLRKALPLFEGQRFGWGLDYIWTRLICDPIHRSGIVDAVAIEHLRGGQTGSLYRETANLPLDEQTRLLARVGMRGQRCRQLVYGGINSDGVRLARGVGLWRELYSGWKGLRHDEGLHPQASPKSRRVIRNTRKCVLGKLDLSPL